MFGDITVLSIVVIAVLLVCKRIYLRVYEESEECGCVSKEGCSMLKCQKDYHIPGIDLK